MSFLVEGIVEGLVGGAIVGRWQLRRARRRLESGEVDCALRALEGRVLGVSTVWSHGRARLSAGNIRFEPKRGVVGVRDIAVVAVDRSDARRPGGREAWSDISPSMLVWRIVTPAGPMEWAVHGQLMEAAAALIEPNKGNE